MILFDNKFYLIKNREEVKNCKDRIVNLEKKRDETYELIEAAQEENNM